ncbi:hypothetical protein BKA59DRAFT_513328 [Fusarium tricinctum]|uniref:Uncharacterized protein n=2 Tax=Fusarium tricinctum species complex TaxID=679429 RepID=A0A8K0W9Q6_9HYPO|nr:hypothetical protein BKA59DRAFT_513328 [Fusarium tricinctum]
MKLSWARQAAVSGLVAVAVADMLPLDDIPLMCVTICGPIVELTAKCDVHQHRLAKRYAEPEWVPKLAVEPPEADDLHKRSFSIIKAAPTSFPPPYGPEEESTSLSTSLSTTIPSTTIAEKTTVVEHHVTSLLDATTSSLIRSTTIIQPTKSRSADESSTMSGTSWGVSMQTETAVPQNDPEKECVCKNKSFDVAKIAALCQDCIVVDGHKQNNMDIIMEACGFAKRTYTPEQDSVADNVKVEATQPAAMGAKDAPANAGVGVESAGRIWVALFSVLLGIGMAI